MPRFLLSRTFIALLLLIVVVSASVLRAQTPGSDRTLPVIPAPQRVEFTEGAFTFSPRISLLLTNPKNEEDVFSVAQLSEELQSTLGLRLRRTNTQKGKQIVLMRLARSGKPTKSITQYRMRLPDSLAREGYLLDVQPGKIVVAAWTGAGLFYGVQTLKQLVRSYSGGKAIPCMSIADWPALRYRGWMDDISRGPIPTMAFLKDVIATMAEYKQNFFTLYTEHVFHLRSHPEVAPADGLTAEQVKELTAFAKQYHIELIGNAQSFGHMEHILESPFYYTMRENDRVVSPATEETYTFLRDMYSEIVPAYESRLFHINCDEVSGLGNGPAHRLVDSLSTGTVYANHIRRISEIMAPYGKRPMMWGDIAAENPQIIPLLPKDLIIVSWGYHAAESFEDALIPFKKTGFDFMVAPGVSCWRQVWPQMSNAVINIANYTRDGAKLGALGVMNTAWDDDGENLFVYNWHGLLWGAECAWQPMKPLAGDEARRDRDERLETFQSAFNSNFFGAAGVTESLFLFDSLRALPVRRLVTDAAVWRDPLDVSPEEVTSDAAEMNRQAIQTTQALIRNLERLRSSVRWHPQVIHAALFAAQRVLFTGRKNLAAITVANAIRSGNSNDIAQAKSALSSLLAELHLLKATYAELWQQENRSWWLDRALDKYDRLGEQLLDLDKKVMIQADPTVVEGKRTIVLRTPFGDQQVYYTTDGSSPSLRSFRYTGPFTIDHSSLIRARVYDENAGYPPAEQFILVHKAVGNLAALNSRYSRSRPAYAAGGEMGLLDGLRGSEDYADGRWQGYEGQDIDIVIDLKKETDVSRVSIGCYQQSSARSLMPERIQVFISDDGKEFTLVREIPNSVDPKEQGVVIRDFTADLGGTQTRYLRLVAKNPGKLPAWRHAAGNDAYIFADEVVIE